MLSLLVVMMILSCLHSLRIFQSPIARTARYLHDFTSHTCVNYRKASSSTRLFSDAFYSKDLSPNAASDTIYALSSGTLSKTGVAVIRLSGPSCQQALLSLQLGKDCMNASQEEVSMNIPKPRYASLRKLYDPVSGDILDQALVLYMPGPRSFTGEDVVELHTHGSRAVIQGVFNALASLDKPNNNQGLRPADRGEFTRRAFDHGRMDLTEVEGLSDLLEAETATQRKQALNQMEGYLSVTFEKWRGVLVKCLAHTEAVIDFGDDDREEDVDDDALYQLLPSVKSLRDEIEYHLKDNRRGEIVREGLRIALVGPPNAGKSSLMNALARRPAAIVSPIAGTTRDIVEVRMDLADVSCIVSDTAGLRKETDDPIEQEGIKRAQAAFARAHLKVFVGDITDQESIVTATDMLMDMLENQQDSAENMEPDDTSTFTDNSSKSNVLMVLNKCDLSTALKVPKDQNLDTFIDINAKKALDKLNIQALPLSCTTGDGMVELESVLCEQIKALLSTDNNNVQENALITRDRHRRHLMRCASNLDSFLTGRLPMDAAAEELRLASLELGKITGRVDVEELLDIIFKDFCIGK